MSNQSPKTIGRPQKYFTKEERKEADKELGTLLREGNPKKLNRRIYGAIYLFFAKMIFRP